VSDPRLARFPSALASRARLVRLGRSGIPALLAHPGWTTPRPTLIWLHGRTVDKTLDTGRYLRLLRAGGGEERGAGIASCAIDLPGHGERLDASYHSPLRTLDLLAQTIREIDQVCDALADPAFGGLFDLDRLAIGGMSAGGMAVLRRLCDDHPFLCAAVESTCGDLAWFYDPARPGAGHLPAHAPEAIEPLDPSQHLSTWRPIPLLALHSEADRVTPLEGMTRFLERLRSHYARCGAVGVQPRLITWPQTGAPDEHSGFGRVAAEAKTHFVSFLEEHLLGIPSGTRGE
jgi:alpha-beta hydrolase superfamily lysophospholipase